MKLSQLFSGHLPAVFKQLLDESANFKIYFFCSAKKILILEDNLILLLFYAIRPLTFFA